MFTPIRVIIGCLIVALIAGVFLRTSGVLGAAPVPGTPTAANCAAVNDHGTPAASPSPHAATPSPPASPTIVDEAALIAALADRGVTITDAGSLSQPFFHARDVSRLLLSGASLSGCAEVQVYAYDSAEALAADVSQITPDGNLRTVMIEWIAPPHFFQGERVLVLYLGDDQAAIDLLTDMLGPQFAGR